MVRPLQKQQAAGKYKSKVTIRIDLTLLIQLSLCTIGAELVHCWSCAPYWSAASRVLS
jgi:hypothetical protein